MAVTAGRQEFSVREAADYLGVDVRLASSAARTRSVARSSSSWPRSSAAVRLAHDQGEGLALRARLVQGVRFRSTATNTTSIKGEKRNRTIAKLIRSWHLFNKGGDNNGMAEAAEQLARLGITRA